MSGRFPEPGKIFEGKWEIQTLLGSGGFARVYRAEQLDLERPVALKVLSPQVSSGPGGKSTRDQLESVAIRFEREAKIVSRLRCPYTISVYEYGRTDNGLLYMSLEYVDGVGLDEIDRPLAPRRCVHILKQVAMSLQEAHAQGLLHRDLKPANIMVFDHMGQKDQVRLLDFGIAKMISEVGKEDQKDLTAADSLIGTPRYMSPEQIRGEDIQAPSDIYSIGLVIYELLVGEKAITSSDSIEILSKHISPESFELPRSVGIHPDLRRIVNKMLAKDLSVRYASCDELLADLNELDKIPGDLSWDRSATRPEMSGAIIDYSGERSGELEIEPIEPDPAGPAPSVEVDGGSSNARIAMVAVILLVAVGAALFGAYVLFGDQATDTTEAVAEPEPVPEPEPEEVAAGVSTTVQTRPADAIVYVDGKLIGRSPAKFDAAAEGIQFPAVVKVMKGDHIAQSVLKAPGGEHLIEIPAALAELAKQKKAEAEAAKKDEPADKPEPRRVERPKPRPKPVVTPKPKPTPEPEEATGAKPKPSEEEGAKPSDKPAQDKPVAPAPDPYMPLD